MKNILFFIIIICGFATAQAQSDSVLVVIECDSLYRPFLECHSTARVNTYGKEKNTYNISLGLKLSFQVPLPKDGDVISVSIYCNELNSASFVVIPKDSNLKIKRIQYPQSCEHNKFVVDNTCSTCYKNDSVSRIIYGWGDNVNSTIEFCNPYNCPYVLPHFSAGCIIEDCRPHWYCNRCKREY